MRLDEIVAWYQKKIGTYDKQQWEKTVEQRILNGFSNVPLKTTTLKTELIDVDLVRGSSFPKAKAKQSLLTVLRLAILRLILLPVYAKWWVEQTSPKVFSFLLIVYLVQMFNWSVYSYNINQLSSDSDNHIVSISELLIPAALSLILSIIHSQIVATASNNGKAEKRRQRHLQPKPKKRERVKRRKKNCRARSTPIESKLSSNLDTSIPNELSLTKPSSPLHSTIQNNLLKPRQTNILLQQTPISLPVATTVVTNNKSYNSPYNNTLELVNRRNQCDKLEDIFQISSKDSSESNEIIITSKINSNSNESDICTTNFDVEKEQPSLRKRNVNWDSPIKSQVLLSNFDHYVYTFDKNDQSSELNWNVIENIVRDYYDDLLSTTENEFIENDNIDAVNQNINAEQTGDDDGFESLNGKSSSGEENVIELQIEMPAKEAQSVNKFRNEWVREILENGQNKISDSDTDTLKGNNSNMITRKNSFSLPLTTTRSTNFKQNLKLPNAIISSESELDFNPKPSQTSNILKLQNNFPSLLPKDESSDTDEDNEDCETGSTPGTGSNPQFTEVTTSATEWIGVTTNSEECSYSSELNQSDTQNEYSENALEYDFTPTVILNPSCGAGDRISCTIWDRRETKKAEMSVLDISSAIIEKVEAMPETCDYIYIGVTFTILLSFIPRFCRLCEATFDATNTTDMTFFEIPVLLLEKTSFSSKRILLFAFGETIWEQTVLTTSIILRLCLSFLFFFLLAVAERTFKQRFLYAKLFSHLTSSRRAKKSEVPHFRLNKVRNIKTWLSVRSYLKRRGPQRSVDVIVSAAFILTLLLLAFLSVEWLKDSVQIHSQFNLEALLWSCALGIFLLRFMTLGTKINRKYRSISVLITEQINLYLQIEQKPTKKEELMVANSVLKLAADLLKELESPFKISGLSANPYLYTTVKVVILSALSGVLSEILGFKLKLHKIKIK